MYAQEVNPGKVFQFHWRSGQAISFEIQSPYGYVMGMRSYETAASQKFSEVDALVRLSKRIPLSASTKRDFWKTAGSYFVECEIREISPEQWKAFENYIKPGDGWKQLMEEL
jgi:hypothetical protein